MPTRLIVFSLGLSLLPAVAFAKEEGTGDGAALFIVPTVGASSNLDGEARYGLAGVALETGAEDAFGFYTQISLGRGGGDAASGTFAIFEGGGHYAHVVRLGFAVESASVAYPTGFGGSDRLYELAAALRFMNAQLFAYVPIDGGGGFDFDLGFTRVGLALVFPLGVEG